MSSERSTFVRRWPSVPALLAYKTQVVVSSGCEGDGGVLRLEHTVFPAANFFSVAMICPLRWAALRAPFPLTTVSRWPAPPFVLLPILVTVSQSSAMMCRCIS